MSRQIEKYKQVVWYDVVVTDSMVLKLELWHC